MFRNNKWYHVICEKPYTYRMCFENETQINLECEARYRHPLCPFKQIFVSIWLMDFFSNNCYMAPVFTGDELDVVPLQT